MCKSDVLNFYIIVWPDSPGYGDYPGKVLIIASSEAEAITKVLDYKVFWNSVTREELLVTHLGEVSPKYLAQTLGDYRPDKVMVGN